MTTTSKNTAVKETKTKTRKKIVVDTPAPAEKPSKKAVDTKETTNADIFSKSRTNETAKTNAEKANAQKTEKTARNSDNVRLSSVKQRHINDVLTINSTFLIETACCIASRTLKRVTVQQICAFVETAMTFKKFHYSRETTNIARVRNHVKATLKKQLYTYDPESQLVTFADSFVAENRKNKTHIETVDKDLAFIIETAKSMNHVLIK